MGLGRHVVVDLAAALVVEDVELHSLAPWSGSEIAQEDSAI